MPGYDKKGPQGLGPGTGRGFGPCFGFGVSHFRHHHRGLGRYFGWSWPQNAAEKKKALAEYRKALEEELEDTKKEEVELTKNE
jgi:hypothetical protein